MNKRPQKNTKNKTDANINKRLCWSHLKNKIKINPDKNPPTCPK